MSSSRIMRAVRTHTFWPSGSTGGVPEADEPAVQGLENPKGSYKFNPAKKETPPTLKDFISLEVRDVLTSGRAECKKPIGVFFGTLLRRDASLVPLRILFLRIVPYVPLRRPILIFLF